MALVLPLMLSSLESKMLRIFAYSCMVIFFIIQTWRNLGAVSARTISLNLALFVLFFLLGISQKLLKEKIPRPGRQSNPSTNSTSNFINLLPHGVAVINEDSQLIMSNKTLRNSLADFDELSLEKLLQIFGTITNLKFQDDSVSKDRVLIQSFESISKLNLKARKSSTLNRIVSLAKKPSILSSRQGANSSSFTDTERNDFPMSTDEPLMGLGFENLRKLVEFMVQNMRSNIDQDIGWNSSSQQPEFIRVSGKKGPKEAEIWIGYGNCNDNYQLVVVIRINDKGKLVESRSLEKNQMTMLASIVHEFRTPLNGTMLMLETSLGDSRIPNDIKRNYLEISLRSLQRLSFLINDILDISQIKAQKIKIQSKSIEVVRLVEDVAKVVSLQASMKRIGFKYEIHSNVPKFLISDENRLQQILINLLANAIKFTFNGQVDLVVQKNQQDSSLIEFRVNDTGIGISEADQSRLFQEYEKLESSTSINPNGVGLGLVISNTLAQMLGTGISFTSKEGLGSSFYFSIPNKSTEPLPSIFSKPKLSEISIKSIPRIGSSSIIKSRKKLDVILERRRSSQSISLMSLDESRNETIGHLQNITRLAEIYTGTYFPSPNSPKQRTEFYRSEITHKRFADVLIVDDDPFCVASIEAIIKSQGLTTMSAYNGEKAVAIIEDYMKAQSNETDSGKIRLIFIDCEMPVMNGFKACQIIKQLLQKAMMRPIPIIGCSGRSQANEQLWKEVGMDDYVLKPLTVDIVLEKLHAFVIQSSMEELLV